VLVAPAFVRRLDPLPEVPARIEPLGPAPARSVPPAPTWSQFAESLCPVRELTAGDRPREWADSTQNFSDSEDAVAVAEEATELAAPARLEPEHYRVQFTAGEEYVKLVEHAQALLSHSAGRVPLDELALRAMRALVAELEKGKRAATKRPARAAHNPANEVEVSTGSAGALRDGERAHAGQSRASLPCTQHSGCRGRFGADFIEHARDSRRHESLRRQTRS
jgi:hypothetical protein